MTTNHVDPNDPANLDLMARVAAAAAEVPALAYDEGEQSKESTRRPSAALAVPSDGGGYFRLENQHDQLVFCAPSEVDRNWRFRLLRLRNNGVQEFRHFKMVPANEREISKSAFESLGKK